MIIMIIKCKDPGHKMGSSPPSESHCTSYIASNHWVVFDLIVQPLFILSRASCAYNSTLITATSSQKITSSLIYLHPIYTVKLVSTWYTKLENKTGNNPEEGALVIETILDQSKEPIRAQRCQRPSHLVFHSLKQKLVKCTSGFLLQQNV